MYPSALHTGRAGPVPAAEPRSPPVARNGHIRPSAVCLNEDAANATCYEEQYLAECGAAQAKARRGFTLLDPALGEESVYVESFFSWSPRTIEFRPPRLFYARHVGVPNPAYLFHGDWPGLWSN
uniref:Uncharacterized protein n=1 Tax=Trichuris muris TaxID=70415 RepID=A0A5S6QH38_TRIMR